LLASVIAGLALFLVFAALDGSGSPLVHRYMFGHWVNKMTTALFCVGAVALVQAGWGVWWQSRQLGRIRLPVAAMEGAGDPGELANKLAAGLAGLSGSAATHWLTRRAVGLTQTAARKDIREDLGASLTALAEDDLDRQAQRYGLPRILVWAMPLLGFLGTVLGISEAMGSLQVGGESELPQMMSGLQANLNVAFDTTAQALVLSILVMFGVFFCERSETRLLGDISSRAEQWAYEVWGRSTSTPAPVATPDQAAMQSAWETLARSCVATWERSAREQFDTLAREPSTSRRIEAALVDLTTAIGQLQRQLNLARGETADSRPTIRKWAPDRDQKAA
jgi:biopolymer transport protein ExbB/TolQ